MSDKTPVTVAAFTGGKEVPSARFRLRQYSGKLSEAGVDVREYWTSQGAYPPSAHWRRPFWLAASLTQRLPHLLAARAADVTLLQREMISTLVTLEGLTPRPRILDVDDAIHLFRDGRTAQALARRVDLVIVGNPWLAEAWRRWTPHVEVLPTAVDLSLFDPLPALGELPSSPPVPSPAVIGWIGTSGNLRYLEAIAPALREVVRRFPKLVLSVCCDRPPQLDGIRVRFVPWSPDAERSFFRDLSVGLMPMEDSLWEKGKCSFKMLQYLAAGRPCVVSPYGMNAEVLAQSVGALAACSQEDWTEALCTLLADPTAAAQRGAAGRELIAKHYDLGVLAPRLAELIRSVL